MNVISSVPPEGNSAIPVFPSLEVITALLGFVDLVEADFVYFKLP
jgi:hypothetical protein